MQVESTIIDLPKNKENIINNYKINFKNISLVIDDIILLKDISFQIENGTSIGITGPTGSGKISSYFFVNKNK